MAVLTFAEPESGVALSTAQTGNGDSTNTLYRRGVGPGAVVIASTAGTTVTVNILGSADGTNFYNVAYALVATPDTTTVAALTITTTVTTSYLLKADQAWDYLKLNLSANTGMTLTCTAYLS